MRRVVYSLLLSFVCLFSTFFSYCALPEDQSHSLLSQRDISPRIPSIASLNEDPDVPEIMCSDGDPFTKGEMDLIKERLTYDHPRKFPESYNPYDKKITQDKYGQWRTPEGYILVEYSPPPARDCSQNNMILLIPHSPPVQIPATEGIQNSSAEISPPSIIQSIPERPSLSAVNSPHASHDIQRDLSLPQGSAHCGVRSGINRAQTPRSTARYSPLEREMLCRLTPTDFEALCADGTFNKETILNDFELYRFRGFLAFARGLPCYDDFMLDLEHNIDLNKKFSDATFYVNGFGATGWFCWKESGFHTFVHHEANRVRQAQITRQREVEEKRRKAEEKRQQQEAAQRKSAEEEFIRRQRCMNVDEAESLESLVNEWTQEIEESVEPEDDDQGGVQCEYVKRMYDRLEAVGQLTTSKNQYSNYGGKVPRLIIEDETTSVFNNTYGTALDRQLHIELVTTCNEISVYMQECSESRRLNLLAPEIRRLAAQAKQESQMEKAFELSDVCFVIARTAFFHIISGNRFGQPLLDEKRVSSYKKGIYAAVSKRFTGEYYCDLIDLAFQTAKVFVTEWQHQYDYEKRLAKATREKNYDMLIALHNERFARNKKSQDETYRFLHQSYLTLKNMPQEEYDEKLAEFGTDMVLDMLLMGVGSSAMSVAKNATKAAAKNIRAQGVKNATLQAAKTATTEFAANTKSLLETLRTTIKRGLFSEEYFAEAAGLGKIMMEEGIEVAPKISDILNMSVKNGKKGLGSGGKTAAKAAEEAFRLQELIKRIREAVKKFNGDLLHEMENLGGHVIKKHKNQNWNKLMKRLNKDGIREASCFSSQRQMINAVHESLQANIEKIIEWIIRGNIDEPLVLEHIHRYAIGKTLKRGKNSVREGIAGTRTVLKLDPTSELGFKILTAFPK